MKNLKDRLFLIWHMNEILAFFGFFRTKESSSSILQDKETKHGSCYSRKKNIKKLTRSAKPKMKMCHMLLVFMQTIFSQINSMIELPCISVKLPELSKRFF